MSESQAREEAAVRVSIEIAVAPDELFQIFVEDVDLWWKRGPSHRFFPPWEGTLRFEKNGETRLVQQDEENPKRRHVIGKVLVWQPGTHLAFEFRLPNFSPEQVTRVDVAFMPTETGTRLELLHTGWETLPADHPAHHGLAGHARIMMKAQNWAGNLEALKTYALHKSGRKP
ncbi:SRPBCC domain-containing protein [Tepidicaulis sp. LMO-SS28]|uniref:SRPBCC domain-containing protein n=1 Tax=Tepidicaulis sp. LMO-SS28 TaxID=3447455 RepID=UPI003EE2C5B4